MPILTTIEDHWIKGEVVHFIAECSESHNSIPFHVHGRFPFTKRWKAVWDSSGKQSAKEAFEIDIDKIDKAFRFTIGSALTMSLRQKILNLLN